VQGADRRGPTAVIRSAAKLDHARTGGTLLNQKLAPALLEGRQARRSGPPHPLLLPIGRPSLQFNVVSSERLRRRSANRSYTAT